jgi:hypothetical protein
VSVLLGAARRLFESRAPHAVDLELVQDLDPGADVDAQVD